MASVGSHGTAYAITAGGELKLLHEFTRRGKAGTQPSGELVLDRDGMLYGGTRSGGAFNGGTVFRMTPAGQVVHLHSFEPAREGSYDKNLVRSADGRLYGTALFGGSDGGGTLFALGEKPADAAALASRKP